MKTIIILLLTATLFSCGKQSFITGVEKKEWKQAAFMTSSQETIYPSANGSLIENTPIGAASNWQCVDETSSDGNSSFVRTFDTNFKTDLYTGTNTIGSGSTINSVTIYFTSRGVQTQLPGNGIVKVKPVLKENGVASFGTEITPTTSAFTQYSETFNVRPSDGAAWTLADINSLEFGISQRATATYNSPRTTQVNIIVDYN